MNNIATKAYKNLFPTREEIRLLEVNYSARFKPFNANAKYDNKKISFYLSKNWLEFSEDLRIGLIQHLLTKIIKKEYKETFEMDLYLKFIKNLSNYSKINNKDAELTKRFDEINKKYFNEELQTPNLEWGAPSLRKLGHYEYTTDTIVISSILREEQELLDYVLFHEALHKKLGFKKTKKGRLSHHSTEFKREEAKFKTKNIEKKLKNFLRRKKIKKALRFY